MAAVLNTVFFLIWSGSCLTKGAGELVLEPEVFGRNVHNALNLTCTFTDDPNEDPTITWTNPRGAEIFTYDPLAANNLPTESRLANFEGIPEDHHSMTLKAPRLCDVGEYTCVVTQTSTENHTATLREFTLQLNETELDEDKTLPESSAGIIKCFAVGVSAGMTLELTVGQDIANAGTAVNQNTLCNHDVFQTSVEKEFDLTSQSDLEVKCKLTDGEIIERTFTLSVEMAGATTESSGTTDGNIEVGSACSAQLSAQLIVFLVVAYLGGLTE